MAEPKAFASLGPTLLARKGSARPAMRPQFGLIGSKNAPTAADLEDLGWNDVNGAPEDYTRPAPLPLTPAEKGPRDDEAEVESDSPPPVLRQQQDLTEHFAAEPAPGPVPAPARRMAERKKKEQANKITAARHRRRGSALESGRRAAFTLRLDPDRHLKLRLASTLRNRSSQQIVTEALDRLFDQLPEVETLAAHVQREQSRS